VSPTSSVTTVRGRWLLGVTVLADLSTKRSAGPAGPADAVPIAAPELCIPQPAGVGVRKRAARVRSLGPVLLVLAVGAFCLHLGGVEWLKTATFTAYLVAGLVVPGTLLWRALGPALRWRGEEYALGAALGYALEAAARIAVSSAGIPSASPAVPVVVIGVFIAVPGLRRHWRSTAAVMPGRIGWAYAAIVAGLFLWLVPSFFASQPLTWPDGRQPGADLTFLLALAGELSHGQWPPEFPYVLGEPLQYHWFYSAHLAAAHTATGIDLPVLLSRLALLPLVATLVVATGALATRLAGRAWAGPLGAFLAWVVTDLTLQRLSETATTYGSPVGSLMGAILWWSPTQTYSAVLFVAAALLAVDVVRGRARRGHWALLALLSIVCVGAKGSALPVLIGGAGAAAGGALLTAALRRSPWRRHLPAVGLLVLLVVVFLPATALLYGAQANGVIIRPFGMADTSMLAASFEGRWMVSPGLLREAVITGLAVVCFSTPWLAVLVLLLRPATRRDPALWLVLGAGVVGTATMVLLYHPGQSQLDFIRSALPLLASAGAWGIVDGLARLTRPVRFAVTALGVGVAINALLAALVGTAYSPPPTHLTLPAVLLPYVMLVALLAVITLGWVAATPQLRVRPAVSAVTVFALLFAGAGATRMVSQVVATSGPTVRMKPLRGQPSGAEQQAALWLREHSDPTDVFATNVQCVNRVQPDEPSCSNLAFWVTAYSERRALVNGWGYTATAARLSAERPVDSGYFDTVPFWDTPRLQRSMALFITPTRAAAAALREDYGVTWVYADGRYSLVSPDLEQVLTLRYRNGPVSLYEIPKDG